MGFYNGKDGSYYQLFVGSNKLTEEQKQFNKLSPEEIREGIEIAQQQWMRDMKDISNEHLKTPYSKTRKEDIEYVVEEAKEKASEEER